MGTRSTVIFKENKQSEPILKLYRQYDGYLSKAGLDYARWLNGFTILNGFSNENRDGKYANGIECLALQFIKEFKEGIGGLYIDNSTEKQDYNYTIYGDDNGKIFISCEEVDFDDTPDEFTHFINKI